MKLFDWLKVKPGTRLYLKEGPAIMEIWFKGTGFDGDLIVTYKGTDGQLRDALVNHRRFMAPVVEAGNANA